MKSQIENVQSNTEKYITYRMLKGRQSAAIKGGFYFEAILIDYSLIEDRLYSYLYHMAIIEERNSDKRFGKTKKVINSIVAEYKTEREKDTINLKNIGDKIKVIRSVIKWSINTTENYQYQRYLSRLKSQCESLDSQLILETLDKIENWKNYRNEIIHSLMTKNVISLKESLVDRAIEGRKLAETLDNELRILKRRNVIRNACGLETN